MTQRNSTNDQSEGLFDGLGRREYMKTTALAAVAVGGIGAASTTAAAEQWGEDNRLGPPDEQTLHEGLGYLQSVITIEGGGSYSLSGIGRVAPGEDYVDVVEEGDDYGSRKDEGYNFGGWIDHELDDGETISWHVDQADGILSFDVDDGQDVYVRAGFAEPEDDELVEDTDELLIDDEYAWMGNEGVNTFWIAGEGTPWMQGSGDNFILSPGGIGFTTEDEDWGTMNGTWWWALPLSDSPLFAHTPVYFDGDEIEEIDLTPNQALWVNEELYIHNPDDVNTEATSWPPEEEEEDDEEEDDPTDDVDDEDDDVVDDEDDEVDDVDDEDDDVVDDEDDEVDDVDDEDDDVVDDDEDDDSIPGFGAVVALGALATSGAAMVHRLRSTDDEA